MATVLLPHLILAGGNDQLRAELEGRLPGADLRVTDDEEATRAAIADAEVVATSRLPGELLDAAGDLRWVHALSAGVDSYDLDRLAGEGVVLTNSSGVHAEPIGEQVLGYLLLFERRILRGIRQQRDRTWERYFATELCDRTVGIVGVGAIGTRVAELCGAVGATVLGVKRDPGEAPDAVDEIHGPDGLEAVLGRAGYLVIACPLTDRTRGLIDADALGRLDDSAVLVNVARGEIVDQAALVRALRDGDLRGAALDVFEEEPLPAESPLWDRDDVVITPHMAGSTPHYWERCADLFAENYRRFAAGDLDELRNRIV